MILPIFFYLFSTDKLNLRCPNSQIRKNKIFCLPIMLVSFMSLFLHHSSLFIGCYLCFCIRVNINFDLHCCMNLKILIKLGIEVCTAYNRVFRHQFLQSFDFLLYCLQLGGIYLFFRG